jgi:hypothetical protein
VYYANRNQKPEVVEYLAEVEQMRKLDILSFAVNGIMTRIKREEKYIAKGSKDAYQRLKELQEQYAELLEMVRYREDLEEEF